MKRARNRITFLAWRDTRHPEAGGSEVYVHRIARELVAHGCTVTLRTSRPPGTVRHEVMDGVRIDRRGGRLGVYPWGLAHVLLGPGRGSDIVVDVINGLPFAAVLSGRRRVIALIHHVHREQWTLIYPDLRGRIGWFVESCVVPRLYRRVPVVTVSQSSKADLVHFGFSPSAVTIIRNGLDVTGAPPPKSPAPRLIVLSRLVPQKQIEHAIHAFAELAPAHPGAILDIVGEGWWRGRLEALARSLEVSAAVRFHGHVDDSVRDDLLGRAWLMVLPSVKEGWSIAVTEAAAMGTPTIGYRSSGGLNESIADGVSGWLVEDRAELLTVIRDLVERPDLLQERGKAARRAALTLDWSESGRAFAALVTRRLSERRRR